MGWPKKIYQWTQHGKRRGRPQQSWKNQVTDFMKSRNMVQYFKAEDTRPLAVY